MVFKVKYGDGDVLDIPWSPDLLCQAYYEFCESRPYLQHLAMDSTLAIKFVKQLRKMDVTSVNIGDIVYVDLRFFGDDWYEFLELPDFETSSYVVKFEYTHWFHRSSKKKLSAKFLLNGHTYALDNYLVHAWGSIKTFNSVYMILVDTKLAIQYPSIVN